MDFRVGGGAVGGEEEACVVGWAVGLVCEGLDGGKGVSCLWLGHLGRWLLWRREVGRRLWSAQGRLLAFARERLLEFARGLRVWFLLRP